MFAVILIFDHFQHDSDPVSDTQQLFDQNSFYPDRTVYSPLSWAINTRLCPEQLSPNLNDLWLWILLPWEALDSKTLSWKKLIVTECKTQKRYLGNKYLEAWLYLQVISSLAISLVDAMLSILYIVRTSENVSVFWVCLKSNQGNLLQ